MAKSKIKPLETIIGNSEIGNSFKTLLANIHFASIDEDLKSIAVVGTGIDEGKTMVSINLAVAIASSGKNVLIVEGDMRKRSLAKIFDIHPKFGIYSVLSGRCTPEQAIYQTKIKNLFFLDSEPNIPAPTDILSTKRFAKLLDNLHEKFNYIIFDTPPLSSFVDGAIISNLTDATLLVVRENKAKKKDIDSTLQQLQSAKANLLGTILTFSSDVTENNYYYAYYNKNKERINNNGDTFDDAKISDDTINSNLSTWLDTPSSGKATYRYDEASASTIYNLENTKVNNQVNKTNFTRNKTDKFKLGAHQTGRIKKIDADTVSKNIESHIREANQH